MKHFCSDCIRCDLCDTGFHGTAFKLISLYHMSFVCFDCYSDYRHDAEYEVWTDLAEECETDFRRRGETI